MGIKQLMKLISDNAPEAIKESSMDTYFGRSVAIDASMSLYQFLIAVRHGPDAQNLTNEAGDITSHITGFFYRTIKMLECGIKPVYVFDGKAPELKRGELEKRRERREDAKVELAAAQEAGNQDDVNKLNKRLVRVSKDQNEDVKRLLRLMGVAVIEAPGEAEATCAAMCKAGLVYATATEDMDALTFGTPKLLRYLTFSQQKDKPVVEIDLEKTLKGMGFTMEQFIDVCILCGCDYTGTIKGIGPKTAHAWIVKHKTIEVALQKQLEADKRPKPEDFLYREAAALFMSPDVLSIEEAKKAMAPPEMDVEGLKKFLVEEKGFTPDRITKAIERYRKGKKQGGQKRVDTFFKIDKVVSSDTKEAKQKEAAKLKAAMAVKGKKGANAKKAALAAQAEALKKSNQKVPLPTAWKPLSAAPPPAAAATATAVKKEKPNEKEPAKAAAKPAAIFGAAKPAAATKSNSAAASSSTPAGDDDDDDGMSGMTAAPDPNGDDDDATDDLDAFEAKKVATSSTAAATSAASKSPKRKKVDEPSETQPVHLPLIEPAEAPAAAAAAAGGDAATEPAAEAEDSSSQPATKKLKVESKSGSISSTPPSTAAAAKSPVAPKPAAGGSSGSSAEKKKAPKPSAKDKQLAASAKGTKSLSSMFGAAKPKTT